MDDQNHRNLYAVVRHFKIVFIIILLIILITNRYLFLLIIQIIIYFFVIYRYVKKNICLGNYESN